MGVQAVIFVQDADFTLLNCDVLDGLRSLPDESVHCCVTSPPYWGLRDYGTASWEGGDPDCDHVPHSEAALAMNLRLREIACSRCGARHIDRQLGLEPTPDEYVARMVEVFREVRRVVRRDGTLWLNLGDSYVSDPGKGGSGTPNGRNGRGEGYARERMAQVRDGKAVHGDVLRPYAVEGLRPKNLVGIPWRVAFALQADGWYLRSDIIWSKPNPMPESVTDRPTKAHEYVFLLTKSPRYFFDAEAVREEFAPKTLTHRGGGKAAGKVGQQDASGKVASGNFGEWDKPRTAYPRPEPQAETLDGSNGESPRGPDGRRVTHVEGKDGSLQHRDGERWPNGGRNVRSVWEIATQPYPEAHFATYPEELVRRCVAAGTSERGCCPVCGKPWERETEKPENLHPGSSHDHTADLVGPGAQRHASGTPAGTIMRQRFQAGRSATTLGWRPGCDHQADPIPCTVLDPFLGSGTTAHVARKHGRRSIGIELNRDYCALAARRMQQQSLFATEGAA